MAIFPFVQNVHKLRGSFLPLAIWRNLRLHGKDLRRRKLRKPSAGFHTSKPLARLLFFSARPPMISHGKWLHLNIRMGDVLFSPLKGWVKVESREKRFLGDTCPSRKLKSLAPFGSQGRPKEPMFFFVLSANLLFWRQSWVVPFGKKPHESKPHHVNMTPKKWLTLHELVSLQLDPNQIGVRDVGVDQYSWPRNDHAQLAPLGG